jgi:hypothetical protein
LRIKEVKGITRKGTSAVRRAVNFTDFRDGEDSLDPPSPSSSPDLDFDFLYDAINRLPTKYADFIRMILEGTSFADIRRLTGYSKSQALRIRSRAMGILTHFLNPL